MSVKPIIVRYLKEASRTPRCIQNPETDPSLPGWVGGKSDNLQVEIYEALKQYAVQVSGAAPGPTAPPRPAARLPRRPRLRPTRQPAPPSRGGLPRREQP